jgi:eukaryotic-like serine/threonine-protein kinase
MGCRAGCTQDQFSGETMHKLGKYDVKSVLGQGATSTVYLGYDPFAQREVAIKVPSPDIFSDPERKRLYGKLFVNEASLAGKLSHPHITHIYDAVVEDDRAYIVMEHVPGGTLERYCQPERLLPFEGVVELIFKCTRALNYAFQLGITHRDIKPANILLGSSDEDCRDIKLSDFGAAITNQTDRTVVSGIGSPAYMSPEQVREETLDHRTDIYSLGVVMYQLLTGQVPFLASSNFNMVFQILNTAPTPPSVLRPDLPQRLEEIVMHAMAKDRNQRYPSWEAFAQDLAAVFRLRTDHDGQKADFADSEKFSSLRGLPFFELFSDVELWEVVRFSRWEQVPPGQRIMADGEPGDFFCFLAGGELKVTKNNKTLSILNEGDCFGEMAVIGQHRHVRGANVVALTRAKIITIAGEALKRASATCRMRFYEAFLQVLASRLTQANQRLSAF